MQAKEVEVLVLSRNERVPIGLHEQLVQRFENSDLKVKFIFTLDFASVPVLPEIWIVEPFLFLQNQPTKEILNKVKWIQQVYAGVDLLHDYFKKFYSEELPFIFTRLGGAIGRQMSEWTLGQIIAQERHFNYYYTNIAERRYERKLTFRSLNELTMGIVGYGDIGRELAKRAKNGFEMKILALKRNLPAEGDEFVDKFYTKMEEMFPECDYIVNILPSTALTRNSMTKEVIECCNKNKKTVFVNIGRGDVIKTETLLYALDNQYFHHAILDVFEVEPLPTDSVLWSRKDVLVSPHISACIIAGQLVDLFEKNIKLFLSGEKLQYAVSYKDEY